MKQINTLSFIAILLLLMLFSGIDSFGQIPIPGTPQPATFEIYGNHGMIPSYNTNPVSPGFSDFTDKRIEQNNLEIMREIESRANKPNPLDDYVNDIDELVYRQQLMNYVKSNYLRAFTNIKNMLEGNAPLDIKKAVFEVEHAFNNTFSYGEYDDKIQELVAVIKYLNGDNKNNVPLNLAIVKAMSDTVSMPMPDGESRSVSYPFTYDFGDYYGDDDQNQMFVS